MHERSIAPCVRRNQRKPPAAAAPRRRRAGLHRVPRRAVLASIDDAVAGLTSACPCRLPFATAPSFALSPNILPRTSFPKDIYIRMLILSGLAGRKGTGPRPAHGCGDTRLADGPSSSPACRHSLQYLYASLTSLRVPPQPLSLCTKRVILESAPRRGSASSLPSL